MDVSDYNLDADDRLTQLVRSKGIVTWSHLLRYVKHLPYGRITDKTDVSLMLKEHKGTCSTKHAFLKQIADCNSIAVDLVIGMYKMTEENTPGIGTSLTAMDLNYIPEAHCYLRKEAKLLMLPLSIATMHLPIVFWKKSVSHLIRLKISK